MSVEHAARESTILAQLAHDYGAATAVLRKGSGRWPGWQDGTRAGIVGVTGPLGRRLAGQNQSSGLGGS